MELIQTYYRVIKQSIRKMRVITSSRADITNCSTGETVGLAGRPGGNGYNAGLSSGTERGAAIAARFG